MTETLVELNRDFTQPACFDAGDVADYEVQGDNSLIVVTRGNETYQVTLLGRCPKIREATSLAFGNLIGQRVCGTLGEAVYADDGARCSIDRVVRTSESEINVAGR